MLDYSNFFYFTHLFYFYFYFLSDVFKAQEEQSEAVQQTAGGEEEMDTSKQVLDWVTAREPSVGSVDVWWGSFHQLQFICNY